MTSRISTAGLLLLLAVLSAPLSAVVGFAPLGAPRPSFRARLSLVGTNPPSLAVAPASAAPSTRIYSSTSDLAPSAATAQDGSDADADDDDEEWEYVEFENLTEEDFYNSEWKIGTLWDGKTNIKETWVRLIVQPAGEGPGAQAKNVAIWGDGWKGKWSIDVASQFFSISKESFGGWLGKKIWAGQADDYYYVQGTVRGWSPISPASVLGRWQMKRLGVGEEEAGVAPWFEKGPEEEEMSIQETTENVAE